ncbi:MAG TPA: O-antigen ligase family protein [Candidatus Omnitrophota bacterium]|nr:O-antigen ligase family protein [Candidatus Omnitrophota bacterium]
MPSKLYRNILQFGLIAVMIFIPFARGSVKIWSITLVELVVLVLVFLWLWKANNDNEPFRKTKIDLPIWLFVVLAVISTVFSIYKNASFLEIFKLLMYIGAFYLVVNNFDRLMSLRLVATIIIMGTAMSVFGLAQYFLGLDHSWWVPENFLSSTYVNHNHFAGYLEMAIPLAIAVLLSLKSDKMSSMARLIILRFGLILSLAFMFVALLVAQSRGAWISLGLSLLVMSIVLIKKKILPKITIIIFLLFIFVAAVYILSGTDDVAQRLRFVEQVNNEGFLEGREKMWKGSIEMIKANPLIGTGIGTFEWGFPRYRPEGLNVRANFAHNEYLQMMTEMGLLALPLMLWIIFFLVSSGLKWEDKSKFDKSKGSLGLLEAVVLGSAIGILSLSIHGLVDFNFHIPANMLTLSVLAGIISRRV